MLETYGPLALLAGVFCLLGILLRSFYFDNRRADALSSEVEKARRLGAIRERELAATREEIAALTGQVRSLEDRLARQAAEVRVGRESDVAASAVPSAPAAHGPERPTDWRANLEGILDILGAKK